MVNYKVSIITPCYNAERFIAQTIDSVIDQTYKNWEMIITDDCSNDKSAQIIQNYCCRDSRIKYFKLDKNSGSPAEPRNNSIEKSTGDIIAFLDADDIWKPNKLEKQIEVLNNDGCEIVYSNGEIIDETGKYLRTIKRPDSVNYRRILMHDELSCSSVIAKKDILNGVNFKKTLKEDYVFFLKLLKQTGAVAKNCPFNLYSYRIVSTSRSRNKKKIISQQWYILRHIENVNFFMAIYFFAFYIISNIYKYYIAK